MATAADLDAQVAAALVTLTGGSRLNSDFLEDENVVVGTLRFQLRVDVEAADERTDANVVRDGCGVLVRVMRNVQSGSERTYTKGAMLTHQTALARRSWWRALAAVHDVAERPEIEDVAERIGNVVQYSMRARVRLIP